MKIFFIQSDNMWPIIFFCYCLEKLANTCLILHPEIDHSLAKAVQQL